VSQCLEVDSWNFITEVRDYVQSKINHWCISMVMATVWKVVLKKTEIKELYWGLKVWKQKKNTKKYIDQLWH
jgi:hypothetical protein